MAKAAPIKPDRRDRISRALYQCISKKGFANTSLKDIAEKAEMSSSHLRYYFDNKHAILAYYAEGICLQNREGLPALKTQSPSHLIEALAAFCLGPGQMNIELSGVIQEIAGLAVHDQRLQTIKSQHSSDWHDYLCAFFKTVQTRPGLNSETAAWQLHATIVGLNTNLVYDGSLNQQQAHQLLVNTIYFLSGLKQKIR